MDNQLRTEAIEAILEAQLNNMDCDALAEYWMEREQAYFELRSDHYLRERHHEIFGYYPIVDENNEDESEGTRYTTGNVFLGGGS